MSVIMSSFITVCFMLIDLNLAVSHHCKRLSQHNMEDGNLKCAVFMFY